MLIVKLDNTFRQLMQIIALFVAIGLTIATMLKSPLIFIFLTAIQFTHIRYSFIIDVLIFEFYRDIIYIELKYDNIIFVMVGQMINIIARSICLANNSDDTQIWKFQKVL